MSLRALFLLPMMALGFLNSAIGVEESSAPKPSSPADPNGIYFQFAIYYTPKAKVAPLKEATRLFHQDFASRLTYRTGVVKLTEGAYVEFQEVKPEEYPPPKVDYLESKGFGVTAAQRKSVQGSETVLVLHFFVVKPKNYDYLVAANELALAVATGTGGLVWDEETRELFSPESWRKIRLPVESFVFANTSMHAYQLPSKNYRTVSFGMRKLGAPDLMVTEFSTPFWEPMGEMMRFLVYQTAAAGPLNSRRTWTGEEMKTLLKLKTPTKEVPPLTLIPAPSEEGDPRNRILTVDFLEYPGKTYEEKQAYAIDRFFRPSGGLMKVWREREKLMELSDKARDILMSKKVRLDAGLAENEQLLVKAFHEETYVWIRVKEWDGERLRGEQVPNVDAHGAVPKQAGKATQIMVDQVFDYLHIHPDGREEGNETTKFIQSLQKN